MTPWVYQAAARPSAFRTRSHVTSGGSGSFSQIHAEIDAVRMVKIAQNDLHSLGEGHHFLRCGGGEFVELVQVSVGHEHDVAVGVGERIENDVTVGPAMGDAG